MKTNAIYAMLIFMGFLLSCSKEGPIILEDVDDVCEQMNDINFMQFCYENYDVNGDGKVSMIEASAVSEMFIYDRDIKSLIGIEYFTNLVCLDCSYNNLTSLDLSHNLNISTLDCCSNSLTSLNLIKNANLTTLECSYNDLKYIDLRNSELLTFLNCENNNVEEIILSQTCKDAIILKGREDAKLLFWNKDTQLYSYDTTYAINYNLIGWLDPWDDQSLVEEVLIITELDDNGKEVARHPCNSLSYGQTITFTANKLAKAIQIYFKVTVRGEVWVNTTVVKDLKQASNLTIDITELFISE